MTLETDAGDLTARYRLCERLINGEYGGSYLYYGTMPVALLEPADPEVIRVYDVDGVPMDDIEVTDDIEALRDELDSAYKRRLDNL